MLIEGPRGCPDCGVRPGWAHESGCDVERCSVCGLQAIGCEHGATHDPRQTFWTGYWPGDETCRMLGIDHNDLAVFLAAREKGTVR